MSMRKYPTMRRGDYLDLTDTGHLIWMRDNNPDGWDDETWRAFTARCALSHDFKVRARAALQNGDPRPHPTEDGWKPPKHFDPLSAIG